MKKILPAAALLAVSLTSSQALLLTFDSGPLTSGSGNPLSSAFTIEYAILETEAVDGNGAPISPFYTADPTASPVTAYTASEIGNLGFGPATSAALGTYDQPVLFTFASPVNLAGFSTVLDNSTRGNAGIERIQFFDAADVLLASINLNQGTPGLVASSSAALTGVKKILLPTTAFYDNMELTPGPGSIPEPSLSLLAALGSLGLALRRRRAGV